MNRRQFAIGLSALAAPLMPSLLTAPPSLAGDESNWRAAVRALIGNVQPIEGRVHFEIPFIARYDSPFRLEVSVESRMTEREYVRVVHVLATKCPDPRVASFHFTPRSGRAMATTRIRLSESQEIVGLAQMSDGAWYVGRGAIKIRARAYPL